MSLLKILQVKVKYYQLIWLLYENKILIYCKINIF